MPSYIGIPVREGASISLFTSEWQTMLVYFSKQLGRQPFELTKGRWKTFKSASARSNRTSSKGYSKLWAST